MAFICAAVKPAEERKCVSNPGSTPDFCDWIFDDRPAVKVRRSLSVAKKWTRELAPSKDPNDEEHDQGDEDHDQRDGDGPFDIANGEFQVNAGGQHFGSLPRRAGEHKDRAELAERT